MEHFPVADLHIDVFMWTKIFRYNIRKRHKHLFRFTPCLNHFDLPRAFEGGLKLGGFGIVVPPYVRKKKKYLFNLLNHIHNELNKHPELKLIRNPGEIDKLDGKKLGVLLGVEGGHSIENDINAIETLWEEGVRYFTLVHLTPNHYGYPSTRKKWRNTGLTEMGKELVKALDRKGFIVDLAHISYRGFFETLEIIENPPFVSHTGVSGVKELWRNIDDSQIKAVADKKGIIGIIFYPFYLAPRMDASLEWVIRHISYCAEKSGIEHVCLGSDFDGLLITLPHKLEDVSCYQNIASALLKAGFNKKEINLIMYENVANFIKKHALKPASTS